MVDRLGFAPAYVPMFQGQLMAVPTPGFGYLIMPQDQLSALLMQAYGQQGLPYAQPFMHFNGHLPPHAFGNFGPFAGQPLYFPPFAQLQALQANMPTQQAITQLFQQAGLPPSAAQAYFQQLQQLPVDPQLAQYLQAVMATGYPQANWTEAQRWIDQNRTVLSADDIREGAGTAIREGRTSQGGRGTQPTPGRVDRAVTEDWRPRTGAPTSAGVVPMSQLDYNSQLGNGSRTIRQAGCFMTSMTMAASRITGDTSLNPAVANQRIRAAGGYSGSNLNAPRAAEALGMRMTSRDAVTPGNQQRMITNLDRSLEQGRPVVAGVDYKGGSSSGVSNADHFVTITGRNADGSYSAIDPAGGREITFRRGEDGYLHARTASGKNYRVSEMAFFERR